MILVIRWVVAATLLTIIGADTIAINDSASVPDSNPAAEPFTSFFMEASGKRINTRYYRYKIPFWITPFQLDNSKQFILPPQQFNNAINQNSAIIYIPTTLNSQLSGPVFVNGIKEAEMRPKLYDGQIDEFHMNNRRSYVEIPYIVWFENQWRWFPIWL